MDKIANRKTSWFTCLILANLLFCGAAAIGDAADQKRYTLSEAVRAALLNNHELKAKQSSLSAKQEDIGIARSALLPKISFEERYLRTVNPGYAFMTKLNQKRIQASDFIPDSLNHPDAVNDFQTSLSFEQPVFLRKANIGLEISETEAKATAEELQRKKEETAFNVVKYYLMVGTAAEYARVAEKARDDAREHQRLAKVRYEAGLGLYSDTLRASTASAEADLQLTTAHKNLSIAKKALGLITGLTEAIDIAEAPPALPVRDLDHLQAEAMARRDIKAFELRKENARNTVKLAESSYFPSLGVRGDYQLNDHTVPVGSGVIRTAKTPRRREAMTMSGVSLDSINVLAIIPDIPMGFMIMLRMGQVKPATPRT